MKDAETSTEALLDERILVLDGAWGVLIQRRGLGEEEYRGERFRDHPRDVAGDPDLLNLTRPEIVARDPRRVLRGRRGHRDDEHLHGDVDRPGRLRRSRTRVDEMNLEGARLARAGRADDATPEPRFVAGSVGPLNVTLSLSPKVDDPAFRAVTFDAGARAYAEQIRGAARRRRRPAPDRDDLRHAEREGRDRRRARRRARAAALDLVHGDRPQRPQPLRADGRGVLALGRARRAAHRRRQLLARRDRDAAVRRGASRASRRPTSRCHPNAGPAERVRRLRRAARTTRAAASREFAEDGLVNVVGGCCGTTPEHIARDRATPSRGLPPRRVPRARARCRASAASSRSRSARTRAS